MALNNKQYCSNELDGDRPLRLEHRFLVLRKLGQGTYGKVQLALNKETNEEVAVKTIKKAKIENEEDMLRIRREIHIMTSLRHPHIIHIHEVFETRQKIVIVMQYANGGELYDYLGCHQMLPEDEARRIFRQIASAIYYCHQNKICHRDLKLENILLDEEGNAQIADFGLSNIFDDKRRMNTFCGSPLYASPEIVKGTPYKGPEVDCWSLGVLLYTLVYGTMPFDGRSFKELVSQISEGRYEEPIYKSNASSLIRWLLTPDISRRATILDVCKDSWVNESYDVSLLEVSETMALSAGAQREQMRATKLCLETNTKNEREKSIFRKAATQLEEKAGKFTSLFTKNFENIIKTNDVNSHRKSGFYDQLTNYDVRFVLNRIISAVEASINAEKKSVNATKSNMAAIYNLQKKEDPVAEKVDSAYIIPIFEVTSTIPNESSENSNIGNKNTQGNNAYTKVSSKSKKSQSLNEHLGQNVKTQFIPIDCNGMSVFSENGKKPSKMSECNMSTAKKNPRNQVLLTDSQKQFYSLNVLGQPDSHKTEFQTRKIQQENPQSSHLSGKTKHVSDSLPVNQKQPGPFMRTKNHVLSLARLLSLNYEKIMRNSFRMPASKKKLPGKITIPPTFDPNNPPSTSSKKMQEEKKELLIFPTVSVSENKQKIEKKIEKIKRAALNKNLIIRSDSKTRMRIENYIRSQVKRIQDLVREEQRSLQASLEHLDEQSLRDMSEMYYCAFGSENTDSGIANTEDDEYFCFLCSKTNSETGASGVPYSLILDSIKKGCLYTSNHLHIPRGKEQNKWSYGSNTNMEFGQLTRCKSEIEFPTDYLNYISPSHKSDLSRKIHPKQQIQRNDIGNTKCFLTIPSISKQEHSDLRILRSASDSVGLNLSKNTFEVLKLNTDNHKNDTENYIQYPLFLEQTSSRGYSYSQTTDYETQSSATDTIFMNASQILDKDDGIGDSNDSFQSYIESLENNAENGSSISRSMSSHSCMNFTKDGSSNKQSYTTMLSKMQAKHKYAKLQSLNIDQEVTLSDVLDSDSWIAEVKKENGLPVHGEKYRGLKRRNTMTCLRRKNEDNENLNFDQSSSEFENYLWNAYKEHLLENNQNDTEYYSSPNLNYYSLDRKAKFKNRDTKSMDYINSDSSTDFMLKEFSNFTTSEQDSSELSSMLLKNVLKHSNVTRNHANTSTSRLNRTKSMCTETLSDSDRDDILQRLRFERKLSHGNSRLNSRSPLTSSILEELEKRDHRRKDSVDPNRRRHSKTNLPLSKRTKSEYKKSFLQLLALKRVQEAEKELDKAPKNDQLNYQEENPGSLLEALKTHGYKTVISQRFQDTEDDFLDPFHMKYFKSPRNLRAELARLNYMYYESLPRYTIDPYEDIDYYCNDLDYTRNMLNGLATPSYYNVTPDFRQQTQQSIHDWLDTTQFDEYLSSLRPEAQYISEEITFPETRRNKCCTQWSREHYRSFDDESTTESQDTLEESPSNGTLNGSSKNKEVSILNETSHIGSDRFSTNSVYSDDERHESVQDRIWRKSFYSRFNNRALSRKERASFVEPELSENRLGLLNNTYSSSQKAGFENSERLQRAGSNKSFSTKRLKKQLPSFDKCEPRSSIKKKYAKPIQQIVLDNEESNSSKKFNHVSNSRENEKPEH